MLDYNTTKKVLKQLGVQVPKYISKEELADLAEAHGVQLDNEPKLTKLDLVLQKLDELNEKLDRVLDKL